MIDTEMDAGMRRPMAAADRRAGTAPKARRLSPRMRKLVLAAHVLVAVGWFGIVVAKLILEITAVTTADQDLARAAFVFMGRFDRATFPPAALATLVTGVILSVGTAWGLFQQYWIVAKLLLTVAVIVTGVAFVGEWTRQLIEASPGGPIGYQAASSGVGAAATWLIGAAVAHALMLGAATFISVVKPWGRIRAGRATA